MNKINDARLDRLIAVLARFLGSGAINCDNCPVRDDGQCSVYNSAVRDRYEIYTKSDFSCHIQIRNWVYETSAKKSMWQRVQDFLRGGSHGSGRGNTGY